MSEKRSLDTAEEESVDKFYIDGCGCKLGKEEGQCYRNFTKNEVRELRDNIFELEDKERDTLVFGFLLSSQATNGDKTKYTLRSFHVCRKTFLFCLAISKHLFSTLCKHMQENGPVPRVHGNTRRQPHNAFPLETREKAVNFLENFADMNAVTLSRRRSKTSPRPIF